MSDTIKFYLSYYCNFLIDTWDHMGPQDYGILLATIGIVGFLAMKGRKR